MATGSPDVGGSRASMAIMAAETLGVEYDQVRAIVADTGSVGYTHVTGGSRVTFATGLAVVNATKIAIADMCTRAAKTWGVDPEGVVWEDGHARPASSNVGDFKPMSIKEIAAKRASTGGPITSAAGVNPAAVAPGYATQFCDVEVDPDTGKVTILRYTPRRMRERDSPELRRGADPGRRRAGHRLGAERGVLLRRQGADGERELPRLPDADRSDVPMIETVIVEVPNPEPPVRRERRRRGATSSAAGGDRERDLSRDRKRLTELPMSPPKVLAAIDG